MGKGLKSQLKTKPHKRLVEFTQNFIKQHCMVSKTFYTNLQIFLQRYICHVIFCISDAEWLFSHVGSYFSHFIWRVPLSSQDYPNTSSTHLQTLNQRGNTIVLGKHDFDRAPTQLWESNDDQQTLLDKIIISRKYYEAIDLMI